MNIDNLIKMANQIGDFFESMPDQAEARADMVNHLKKFWEPRMRQALLAHIDSLQGEGLHPVMVKAITEHRDRLA